MREIGRILCAVLASAVLLGAMAPGSLDAAITVNVIAVGGGGGAYRAENGGTLDQNAVLRFGILDLGAYDALLPEQRDDFLMVDDLFTELGSAAASSSGTFFVSGYAITVPAAAGPGGKPGANVGDQLTVWVFDEAVPTGYYAGQWGLFTSTNVLWDIPHDPGSATLSTVNLDTVLRGTDLGGNEFALASIGVAAVPEPSTWLISGLVLAGAMWWRRGGRERRAREGCR